MEAGYSSRGAAGESLPPRPSNAAPGLKGTENSAPTASYSGDTPEADAALDLIYAMALRRARRAESEAA